MNPFLRDAGISGLVEGTLETLAEGFVFTEGPLWLPDGSLLFQDIKAERTYRRDPSGQVSVLRDKTEAANGQTFGPDGRIYFCEQNGRRISAMNPDGSGFAVVTENWSGKRLNSPNDIVGRSDGLLYFTDPAYGVAPPDRSLHFQGVYALGKDAQPRLVVDDFEKPNGLALSPDERTLYICDTGRYHVRAFDVEPSGELKVGSGRIFCRLDPEEAGGPDGMKVDTEGRVYVAVAQGVWVFEPGGKLLGIIGVPKRPSNLAWCGPDSKTLAITAVDAVHQIRLSTPGVRPPMEPK
ncbi:SMP-30/gluconolactonase/LRE family protein [Singulisphaera sp. PoT]|uniref:SMP-30/gluconolactonase/LRE family protein n=1 Tax=Singulisphaera sp. PoT TaxID=3411797 RepID=UPI003BF502C6